MTIVLTWTHARRLGYLLLVAGMIGTAFFTGYYWSDSSPSSIVETKVETKVCGAFENPDVVMGVPISSQNEYVIFEDGFRLRLSKPHSFYAQQLGLFMLNGSEQSYALVSDDAFDPCPTNETK